MDLVVKFLAVNRASASTCACRIAGLDHEGGDYAVEDDVVVVPALGECREVGACAWGVCSVKFDCDCALGVSVE